MNCSQFILSSKHMDVDQGIDYLTKYHLSTEGSMVAGS